MSTQTSPLHVILGAGQLGPRVAKRLLASGARVRVVQRQNPGQHIPGAERVFGDITDLSFAEEATRGASVVYDCMNPPYHKWADELLPIARGSLHGAARAGAKLVALDCLYMYGRQNGSMNEQTPMNPCSKKGELRVKLSDLRLSAHQRGEVRVTIGRASDFFGAGLPFSAWGERFFQRVFAGKAGECTGDPNMPHSYTYVEDIARALVSLGENDAALGRPWMLPTAPAESTQALATRLEPLLGREVKVARIPGFVLKMLGLFSPFMRELAEMAYQWELPYVIDDSQFRATFGYGATPIETQCTEVASWARAKYAPTRA